MTDVLQKLFSGRNEYFCAVLRQKIFHDKNFSKICERLFSCDYDRLGKVVFDALEHEDNSYRELGKSLVSVFLNCHSQDEFEFKNEGLCALTGYSFQDFLLQF